MTNSDAPLPLTSRATPRQRLRALINRPETFMVPGIQDAFSARAAQEVGFEAVYLGGGVSVGIGLHAMPDMTMVSIADMVEAARPIVQAIDIPLIIDFDDGGGNPLQVRRNVQLAESAGISGLQIEDTDFAYPKHFPPDELGHVMSFKENHLMSREAAIQRIRAAVEARTDPDLIIIARTDGALVSHEESIIRMQLLAEAGADMVFPTHFPYSATQEAVQAVGVPLMSTPVRVGSSNAEEQRYARDGGMRILLEPTPIAYASYRAILDTLAELHDTGVVAQDFSATLKSVQEVIEYPKWGDLGHRYAT